MIIFKVCFNKHFPEKFKYVKTEALMKIYIKYEIKALIKEKTRLQRKYAKSPIAFRVSFRRSRNHVTLKFVMRDGSPIIKKNNNNKTNMRNNVQLLKQIIAMSLSVNHFWKSGIEGNYSAF